MTREEALHFKARWQMVNETIAEEIRRTPVSVKLQQLEVMFAAAQELGWVENLKAGEEEVRERWRKLKEKLHV
ncbi:MAG TPA: hypothetical protein VFD58_22455 [Blastocatellia bacterium]|nr:hypothetical protein [Blastocatellia bacterium]